MQTFAEQLIAARKAKGMTQEVLAQAVNVARNTISSWERGRTVPDIEVVHRLSDVLGADFALSAEEQSAASAAETEPADQPVPDVEAQDLEEEQSAAPSRGGMRRWSGKTWIAVGVAALACVAALIFLLIPRNSAPADGGEPFNVEYYRQETPNDPEHAWISFENEVWQKDGDNKTYQRYNLVLCEKNGIGYNVARVDVEMEGKGGSVMKSTLDGDDLRAYEIDPNIPPYGTITIPGGFPVGEFPRVGATVYGSDTTGKPLTFYSLIEF